MNKNLRIPTLLLIPGIFIGTGLPSAVFASNEVAPSNEVRTGLSKIAADSSAAEIMGLSDANSRNSFAHRFNTQGLVTSQASTDSFPELPVVESVAMRSLVPDSSHVSYDGSVQSGAPSGSREGALSTEGLTSFNYPDSRFDVNAAVALAYSEVGTSRPTGWNGAGECIMSAQRWINEGGGGNWHGGDSTPLGAFVNATEVQMKDARPGDIVQYIYSSSPGSWASGIHTLMITGVNSDGTFRIVESNNPGGSGLVSQNDHWLPSPPSGFEARFFRF